MSQALRKLAGAIAKSNCLVIFINQLREKIGVVYGNPETTTGGRALKFYASMRIDVRKIEQLKATGNEFVGSRTRAKIVKNKVAPPFKDAEFDIMYGKGISRTGELLDLAVKADVVQKAGAWFSYDGKRLGQGRDNVKELLENDKELSKEIEDKLMANIDKVVAASSPAKKGAKAKITEVANAKKPADAPAENANSANIDVLVDE